MLTYPCALRQGRKELTWLLGVAELSAIVAVAALVAFFVGKSEKSDVSSVLDAGFAKPEQTGLVDKNGEESDGIYLGTAGARTLRYMGDRHIMTLGPNGSGKSMRLLYENLLRLKNWSCVVVDPKGDLANLTLRHREKAGSRIMVIDPFGVSRFQSDGCNPLLTLKPDQTLPDYALGMAEAMIRIEGNQPHWPASAQDLVAAIIMGAVLGDGPHASLESVRETLGARSEDFCVTMEAMIKLGQGNGYPSLVAKASRYADFTSDNRELTSIISTALTQTRWLDSPLITADLASPVAHDFSRLKKEPTTIYLVLPPDRMATHSVWLRLMITTILQPLMKDTAKAEVPVLLMLDEYPALAMGDGFPVIARNMAMFRGYGIKLWSVWQDLNQAERIYGHHWESFAANAGVLQAFQPQDLKTAAYLSERTGQTSRHNTNWSWGGRMPSFSGGEQAMPLMLPQTLRNMEPGHALLLTHVAKGPVKSFLPFPKLPD